MSWPTVELGSLGTVYAGGTPSRGNADYWGKGIKWLSIKDYQDFDYVSFTKEQITDEGLRNSSAKLFSKGNVIISIFATLGRVAILGENMATNQAIAAIDCHETIHNKYLMYALKAQLPEIERKAGGVAQKNINLSILKSLQIPLPPLETQKQIAAVLEKADQLRKDCQQMEQELNSLAQSVFIEMFGDPVTNPKGWVKQSLKSISSKFHDGPFGSNLKTSHYTDSGVQVIRLKNIGSGEFKEADKAFVSEAHAETLHKFKCYPGEIVIATLGEPNLRACIIPDSVPVAINKADCVHCVVDSSVINSHYLVEYLNLPSVLHTIQNKLHGQTRTRISSGQLATVDVVIPPLEQQAKYLEMLALRAKLKTDNNRSVHEYRELFNALIQKAFKGELDL